MKKNNNNKNWENCDLLVQNWESFQIVSSMNGYKLTIHSSMWP